MSLRFTASTQAPVIYMLLIVSKSNLDRVKRKKLHLRMRKCAESDLAHVQSVIQIFAIHFIHYVESNDSVSRQERPWSDCADAFGPSLSAYARRHVFAATHLKVGTFRSIENGLTERVRTSSYRRT